MKKSELDLTILKSSLATLKESYGDLGLQQSERIKTYVKDSCVKRFEYTYETAKKIMNKFLKKEYDKTESELSINNIFREMYGLGLIKNFENWVNYREKRNFTFNDYNIDLINTIIGIVPDFIKDTEYLIGNFERVMNQHL